MSRKGGLGLSAMAIGTVMSLSGGIFVKLQYFVYVYMVDAYGLYGSMKLGSVLMWPLVALVPLVLFLNSRGSIVNMTTSNLESAWFHHPNNTNNMTTTHYVQGKSLAGTNFVGQGSAGGREDNNDDNDDDDYGELSWFALIYLTILLSLSRLFSFTFMSSLIVSMNRSVTNHSHRGTMNGFCTMGGSIAKAMGPSFAGLLVAFCLSSNVVSVPIVGAMIMFVVLSILGGITALGVFTLLRPDDNVNGLLLL